MMRAGIVAVALTTAGLLTLSACGSSPAKPSSTPSQSAGAAAPVGASSPSPGGGGGTDDFCKKAFQSGMALSAAGALGDPSKLPTVAAAWTNLLQSAPDEIRPDIETYAETLQKMSLPGANRQQLAAGLVGPSKHLQEWGTTHCKGISVPKVP